MKAKYQIFSLLVISALLHISSGSSSVSALTYQTSTDVSFTFNPTISVSISGSGSGSSSSADLRIDDLAPGTYSDSNVISVTTSTNSTGGYTLLASVGSSTYNNRNLTQSGTVDVFSSIDTDASLANLTTPGTWGYAMSDTYNTTTSAWDFTSSHYSGLPLYNSTDITTGAKTLVPTTGQSGSGTLGFKIAAYADTSMSGGTYSNIINFIATAEPEPHYYIQDFTLAQCQTLASDNHQKVYDIRDEKDYTVRYINGACWMTQNLAIEPGTHMTADDTNITAAQYNNSTYYALPGSGYDLRDNGTSGGNCYGAYSNNAYSGGGWINACSHVADVTDVNNTSSLGYTIKQLGAWYNYAAATAGTIASASDNTVENTYNICPKNWSLPNQTHTYSIIDYASSFNSLYGGEYVKGLHLYATKQGYWWSSSAQNGVSRYVLNYDNDNFINNFIYRYNGLFVRCVHSS